MAVWLQVGPLSFLRPFGVMLPLAATAVVALALSSEPRRALPFALAAGLVVDVAAGRAIGLHALAYLFLVAVAAFTSRRLYTEEPWLAACVTAGALAVERALVSGFLSLVGVPVAGWWLACLLGALEGLPVFFLARWALSAPRRAEA